MTLSTIHQEIELFTMRGSVFRVQVANYNRSLPLECLYDWL